MYVYHATDRKNLESILKNGLLTNPPSHNWDDMYCDGKIFLALDAAVAEDYADASENAPEETVVLRIRLDALNSSRIGYDWNNRCEYHNEINSCTYSTNIPSSLLEVCNASNEPSQEFDDFEGTALYDILYDVFWEDCETNLEREDDE